MFGKIKSIEEIFDWYLKTIEIKSDRKAIERYIKNGSQKVETNKLVFNDLIEDILNSIEIKNEKKDHFRNVLENFIEVYKCFAQYVESYHTSQKQLDFLLAKDLIIPFFALFSSFIFDKYLVILKQIKPDENKKSFQKFLDWAERNICQQDIKKYLLHKYKEDKFYLKAYDNIRKSIDSWRDLEKQKTPKKEHFEKVVRYLEDCKRVPHLNLYNLALFSKLFQTIHKQLEKIFSKEEIELLVEHYYCLLDFYSIQSVSFDINETEDRIYTEFLNHINLINRNHYFDDYFAWVQKVVNPEYITPQKLIERSQMRNNIYYKFPEQNCMNFVEINLPVLYFNKLKPQNNYIHLYEEMLSKKEELEESMKKENINLQSELFFSYLNIEKEKSFDDKIKCNEIFIKLENEFGDDNTNSYICFLKTRYFIFDNNPKEALMTGILLSAATDDKNKYNYFRKIAIKYDSLFLGRLKIPAYGRGGIMIDIPDDKSNFGELTQQHNEYFKNRFC